MAGGAGCGHEESGEADEPPVIRGINQRTWQRDDQRDGMRSHMARAPLQHLGACHDPVTAAAAPVQAATSILDVGDGELSVRQHAPQHHALTVSVTPNPACLCASATGMRPSPVAQPLFLHVPRTHVLTPMQCCHTSYPCCPSPLGTCAAPRACASTGAL